MLVTCTVAVVLPCMLAGIVITSPTVNISVDCITKLPLTNGPGPDGTYTKVLG